MTHRRPTLLLLIAAGIAWWLIEATVLVECLQLPPAELFRSSKATTSSFQKSPRIPSQSARLYSSSTSNDQNEEEAEEAWDANVDYDAEWLQGNDGSSTGSSSSSRSRMSSSTPDPSTAWDALPNMPSDLNAEKLGIDLNLEPLTRDQAEKLQKDASEVINDAIDAGIEDIERLRTKMNREIQASKRAMQLASDLEARQQQEKLMSKIDQLTGTFLQSNEQERKKTQLAAAANRAMEGSGRGLEMGTWGVLDGKTVLADDDTSARASSLLGSVQNAVQSLERQNTGDSPSEQTSPASTARAENRILLIADTKQDSLAKQLVPALLEQFESDETKKSIPNLNVEVLSPTSTMPIGGNNAACVIVFCTSVSQSSTLNRMLDRLLRKTLQTEGQVGTPPTHLVGISTLGTERFDKFPYSMQNLLGGKLEARRQVEEVLINTVKNRVTEPSLDYTLVKVNGDKFGGTDKPLDIAAGDSLDDPTTLETAAMSILQAVAYQPAARNATMSVSGALPLSIMQGQGDDAFDTWQDLFLPLDGPEVWRSEVLSTATSDEDETILEYYNELVEYLREWADLLASSGKGLTTPIRSEHGLHYVTKAIPRPRTILRQDGVQLLFLPTSTGKNYMSRDEELSREKERGGSGSNDTTSSLPRSRKMAREGGLDAVVEMVKDLQTKQVQLRVRARRCNYADDSVIKELSEQTILKRLQEAMTVWKKDQMLTDIAQN